MLLRLLTAELLLAANNSVRVTLRFLRELLTFSENSNGVLTSESRLYVIVQLKNPCCYVQATMLWCTQNASQSEEVSKRRERLSFVVPSPNIKQWMKSLYRYYHPLRLNKDVASDLHPYHSRCCSTKQFLISSKCKACYITTVFCLPPQSGNRRKSNRRWLLLDKTWKYMTTDDGYC